MTEIISDDLMKTLEKYRIADYEFWDGCKICDDGLVYFWNNRVKTYTGLILTSTSGAPFTNVTQWNERINVLCPASGRIVYCRRDSIFVADLF